ncbi:cytochrome c biogenesis protein ResB [Solwaraspora sp. WMMD1047]|uniref:cytochrome c biogenesis protein ResB n=1 Tax=Solwaraspora sp. WMMD1047 TaxID=3016102 RepID=UPI0024180108|nr:cytochrome c biogenesis protein ResB [Solwaraspora sp. WMMD1047]MDG4827907.1 cytochrome c biogenesis protein ResB [Solwaraspora sp. WMMD1047]
MTAVEDRVERPPVRPPRRPHPLLALLRNSWRQLTSMRTALILLFLLAVAAIPGSVLPQRDVNIEDVNDYFVAHPDLAPVLDRLGAFEVFASPWFSAIYVLLFTSLAGCIVPRLRDHLRALRSRPPAAPKRLDRLPQHATLPAPAGSADPAQLTGEIAALLRRRRWRVSVTDGVVAAEKGYLKETGNLLFHFSLIAVLVGVALGSWYGWHGNRLLVAGADKAFCNTLQQYSESGLGPRVDAADLPPFCLELTDFEATFLESGQPSSFNATVLVDEDGGAPRSEDFSVNSPLRLAGANVYLLGHGYAPEIRYTDRNGRAQTTAEPFLTADATLTGEGVAIFPDVNVDPVTGERNPDLQVAFEGLYLPTAPAEPPYVRSEYPAERSPGLLLIPYRGNLGLDAGIPGSVYRLDPRQVRTGQLNQVGDAKLLRPGETWTLDDGTTVEFLGTRRYITISVRYDPGTLILLVGSGTMLAGLMLSLVVRRRRVWFRVPPGETPAGTSTTAGSSLIEVGGLPRTDHAGFGTEFRDLVEAVRERTGAAPEASRGAGQPEGTD